MHLRVLLACAALLPSLAQAACDHYAGELDKMVTADQAMRQRWMELKPVPQPEGKVPRVVQQTQLVDRENTRRLKELIAQCGWPRTSVHGERAVRNAWLLAQHADAEPAFQKQVIVLLEQAVREGEAPGQTLAYLDDRIATAENKPQRYGTQFRRLAEPCRLEFLPLDDRAKVEERRKAVGLSTLDEYLAKSTLRSCGEPAPSK
jgi:hypothetical protein